MHFFKKLKWEIHPPVYWSSSIIIWTLVLMSLFINKRMGEFFTALNLFITSHFSWLYIGGVGVLFIFCLLLLLGPYGDIKLGEDGEKPAFKFTSWMAMLFSAGMGIGLLFYGVAEPVTHFSNPPTGRFLLGQTPASNSMSITFFHWGLHAWSIYVVVGLALAYGHFRKGRPLSIRYTLYPLFGERVEGRLGDFVDVVAVVGTLFGVATSLGLGVSQINSGLSHVLGVPNDPFVQVIIIAFITLVAVISVMTGLGKGIRILSEFNIVMALLLLSFVFLLGPTVDLLNLYIQNIGVYVQNIPRLTFYTAARQDSAWMGSWTLFYWGWWIAWSPFVGMFIARISRGRTIREFVGGVLFIPVLVTFFWMTVFGEGAIALINAGQTQVAQMVQDDVAVALFIFLEYFPMASITSILAIIVIMTFFVTSSDSGSFVIDMITAGGHPNPPAHQKVYWAVMEGLVAAVLLYGGGLLALQTASINAALFFILVILLMVFALRRELEEERQHRKKTQKEMLKRIDREISD